MSPTLREIMDAFPVAPRKPRVRREPGPGTTIKRSGHKGMRRPSPMPETEDLEAFVAIVETGRFQRAAYQLGITQPQLSRRIQRLERLVGGSLMDRGRRRAITLTDRGTECLVMARRHLVGMRMLARAVAIAGGTGMVSP